MSYNDKYGFFYNVRQTVYKWWCVVYKPAYKLFHHGYWPAEKEPYYAVNQAKLAEEEAERLAQVAYSQQEQSELDIPSDIDAQELASKIMSSKQGNIDALVANTPSAQSCTDTNSSNTEPEVDLSAVDTDALARANEIMARLASEAAEDEAKKQAEIDAAKAKAREEEEAAKAKAAEDARLASILQSTKVDISAYIEEGKAQSDKDAKQLESILQSTKVDISAFIEEGKAQRKDS